MGHRAWGILNGLLCEIQAARTGTRGGSAASFSSRPPSSIRSPRWSRCANPRGAPWGIPGRFVLCPRRLPRGDSSSPHDPLLRELAGIAARIPGLNGRLVNRGTGGTDRPIYCRSIWFKHLAHLLNSGMESRPERVGELGPGDSLGVGIAALLTGVDHYVALDVKPYATSARNVVILDGLLELFNAEAPDENAARGWPPYAELLQDAGGPLDIAALTETIDEARVAAIRRSLGEGSSDGAAPTARYVAPWDTVDDLDRGSLDLVLSHSVMEHVRDLPATYAACHDWLRPGGWISQQVDLQCHGLARGWNGHWGYRSERHWNLIAGARDCWINREPFTTHVRLIEECGFELKKVFLRSGEGGLEPADLATRWHGLTDEERTTAGLFLQARKREG
jgi:SAM-dependent methyltransferase